MRIICYAICLETRMESVVHDQERIGYLMDHTDLAGNFVSKSFFL